MITLNLPLPWTLESLWLLTQTGVQLTYLVFIVLAFVAGIAILIQDLNT